MKKKERKVTEMQRQKIKVSVYLILCTIWIRGSHYDGDYIVSLMTLRF